MDSPDFWLPALTLIWVAMICWGFRIGEAPVKGAWIRRREHPTIFKIAMATDIFIAVVLAAASIDMWRRDLGWHF